MMKTVSIFFLFFIIIKLYSQNLENENFLFIEHLINSSEFEDAIYLLNKIDYNNLSDTLKDEYNYFRGWSNYNIKKLDSSAYYLTRVSNNSLKFEKSQFFSAYNYTFINDYEKGKSLLKNLNISDSKINELKNFELAGIALLERDTNEFISYSKNLSYNYYQIKNEEQNIINQYNKLIVYKNKKPVKSALLSATIPGLGKIYCRKTGDGISSFLSVTIMGLVTAENYIKKGFKSPKTIPFGSVFTIFYIGNIWGSYFSASIANTEFNDEINHNILFNLHIPLRTIFN